MNRAVTATFLSLFSSLASAAEWQLKISTDAMTDATTREAFITAPTGEKFTVIRRSDGSVWGYVQLSGMSQFGINDKLLVRVDKNTPMEFDDRLERLSKSLGRPMKTWEWNPSLVGFRMWHGKEDEGCGIIKQMFEGKLVVVRYHPDQSTARDITFEAAGGQKALSDALAVNLGSCPEDKTH